jgi:HSP20 family protein
MKERRETTMAEAKPQTQPSTSEQQSIARRRENYPWGEPFHASPFALMRRFTEEMDRAFGAGFGPWPLFGGAGGAGETAWSPAIEVRERNGNLEITAELPGMNKEDVKVECTSDDIVIQGEKRRETQSDEGGFHRSERVYGRFYRQIPLPDGADASKAKAEFKNGVLQVQVPISEQKPRNRQIPITG